MLFSNEAAHRWDMQFQCETEAAIKSAQRKIALLVRALNRAGIATRESWIGAYVGDPGKKNPGVVLDLGASEQSGFPDLCRALQQFNAKNKNPKKDNRRDKWILEPSVDVHGTSLVTLRPEAVAMPIPIPRQHDQAGQLALIIQKQPSVLRRAVRVITSRI